mmetsp:Transcript_63048/g.137053  ORF Transcript_63048/g.137053 Transcript_63048/m.137053 type:complete len:131 (-) Transcript_63048:40-432(-)
MGDDELAAIRARRMAELQAAQGGGAPGGPQGMSQEEAEAKKQAIEEQRNAILKQILEPDARSRLSTIALVKPEKAKKIEDMLIMNYQRGAIQEPLSEERLKGLLGQISEQMGGGSGPKVTFQRRRMDDDD